MELHLSGRCERTLCPFIKRACDCPDRYSPKVQDHFDFSSDALALRFSINFLAPTTERNSRSILATTTTGLLMRARARSLALACRVEVRRIRLGLPGFRPGAGP